jgi:hypothetical protein
MRQENRHNRDARAITRRAMLQSSAAAVAARILRGQPVTVERVPQLTVTPSGELAERLAMTARRFVSGKTPAFTPEFVLADVALKPPRRFSDYSGDASGRYIGALAVWPVPEKNNELPSLVHSLLQYQRSDGRFGDPSLVFTADAIGPEHMALLWGNGRLLVGLLEYNRTHPQPEILESARRLGDFLTNVQRQTALPEVQKRLAGQGASGFICFTQLIEGLVLLAAATKDPKYLGNAASIIPLLEPRGIQHAHGYLTTLRGEAMLSAATGQAEQLRDVEEKYRDLIGSPDYTVYGSVLEYFGWQTPGDKSRLVAASGADPRDEGCGHADFLRLSLQLWRATGNLDYLERAERCLLNGLLPNQFPSGDFGSRVTFERGFKPAANVDRAWWCCTMHGYRAFPDVLNSIVTASGRTLRVNLFQDCDWSDGEIGLSLAQGAIVQRPQPAAFFTVSVRKADGKPRILALRQPSWSRPIVLALNGKPIEAKAAGGYAQVERVWQAGDKIEVQFPSLLRLVLRDGRVVPPNALGDQAVEAALHWGPWLMGVDEHHDALFFGEPWEDNLIFLPQSPAVVSLRSLPQLDVSYTHGGFTAVEHVTLRPISEMARHEQAIFAVWLRYRAARNGDSGV